VSTPDRRTPSGRADDAGLDPLDDLDLTHGDGRPRRVLVTGAGGPAAVAFMRAVRGPDVELWAVDVDPYAVGLYLVAAGRRLLVPNGDDPGFVDAVAGLCRRAAVDVLVPTVDTELLPLCRRRDELAAAGTTVLAPSVATLECCLDKWRLVQACAGLGITPRTAVLDGGFDPAGWAFPVIAKPRQGSGGRGVRLIDSADQLRTVPDDGSYLVQENLPGVEHSLDVLAYADGRVAAVVPRSRLKVDSGIAVAGCVDADERLVAIGRRVAEAIELTSVANVQVKADVDGRPRLLEVNPRFPGSMPLTVASGVDMPRLALADAIGSPVPSPVPFRPVAMVRHWEDVVVDVDAFACLARAAP
jgi:carbamoyl-phosphate synthase large subunit